LIIDQEKVKPNSEAFHYFKRVAGGCGKTCIEVTADKRVIVSERACAACVNRCKQCPDDKVVSIVKLPTNLTTNIVHRYGPNAFKLHGLPIPRPGHVLGLLGTNGAGKSTALKILSGRIKPNLGNIDAPPDWASIVTHFRGSDLQNYFQRVLEQRLKTVTKPQLEAGFVKRLRGKTVRELMDNATSVA
jgi:ATP-binding cassette subfamily E protein 1